jgi:hypothetical protein
VAAERAGWSALGIVLALVIAGRLWRLAPHLPHAAASEPARARPARGR